MTLEPYGESEQHQQAAGGGGGSNGGGAGSKDSQIAKLAGTLAHYRTWAGQIQARYQMFNPDAARPARRIYVGGLPPDTADVRFVSSPCPNQC